MNYELCIEIESRGNYSSGYCRGITPRSLLMLLHASTLGRQSNHIGYKGTINNLHHQINFPFYEPYFFSQLSWRLDFLSSLSTVFLCDCRCRVTVFSCSVNQYNRGRACVFEKNKKCCENNSFYMHYFRNT